MWFRYSYCQSLQRLTLSLFGSKGIDTYKIKLLSILREGKVGIIDNLSGINQSTQIFSQLSSYILHQKSDFFEPRNNIQIKRFKLEL